MVSHEAFEGDSAVFASKFVDGCDQRMIGPLRELGSDIIGKRSGLDVDNVGQPSP